MNEETLASVSSESVTWNSWVRDSTTTNVAGGTGVWVVPNQTNGTITAPNDSTWVYWNNSSTESTSASTDTWGPWVMGLHRDSQVYAWEPSEEEMRATEQRRVARVTAISEAEALLDMVLSDVQRKCFKKEDWFLVIGKSGKIYRIRRGRVGNIDLVSPEGRVLRTYCVHPKERLPNGDDLVTQMLYLENDDRLLTGMANVHRDYSRDEDAAPVINIADYLPKVVYSEPEGVIGEFERRGLIA